jgi:hypothetical protein
MDATQITGRDSFGVAQIEEIATTQSINGRPGVPDHRRPRQDLQITFGW